MLKTILAGALAPALLLATAAAAADRFQGFSDTVSAPGTRAVAITPSDTADLADTPKAIYVGTGGDIAMVGSSDATGAAAVVWRNAAPGTVLPFRARRIYATGTTATDLVAIY